jgi:hypothetical protein
MGRAYMEEQDLQQALHLVFRYYYVLWLRCGHAVYRGASPLGGSFDVSRSVVGCCGWKAEGRKFVHKQLQLG